MGWVHDHCGRVAHSRVLGRHGTDPEQAYGRRHPGRPEPRPITCGGTFGRALGAHTANVAVPACLTGTG